MQLCKFAASRNEIIENMRTELCFASLSGIKTELLAVLAVDAQTGKGPEAKPEPVLLTTDAAVKRPRPRYLRAVSSKPGQTKLCCSWAVGVGGEATFDRGAGQTGEGYSARRAECGGNCGAVYEAAREFGSLVFALPETEALAAGACARAAVEGALIGDYDPDTYRSDRKDLSVQSFTLAAPGDADKKAVEAAFAEGVIVGESQNFTRVLVNEPGNKLTPTILGQRRRRWPPRLG